MQPPIWYVRRLRNMSVREIWWRARAEARALLDWYSVERGQRPFGFVAPSSASLSAGFQVTPMALGEWAAPGPDSPEGVWVAQLRRRADALTAGRLEYFDLTVDLGDPPRWNVDWMTGRATPLGFAPHIDYRDPRVTGDCKVVWEPNRHHHLVVLGRAYRATGRRAYADAVVRHLQSWLDQNPFGRGMNWRSPLELGIRLINWVWAIDLIRESGAFPAQFEERLGESVRLHLWEIRRKYSRGSSANNHLIGEAAGVFIGAAYFDPSSSAGTSALDEAAEILQQELHAQTYDDGCTRELAFGYHLFVLQFFLLAGITAERAGRPFPPSYWSRLTTMLEFAGAMAEAGPPSMFGDADEGYVLDLGLGPHDARGWMAAVAVLRDSSIMRQRAGVWTEPAHWLLGQNGAARFEALSVADPRPIESRRFESGHFLLQAGLQASAERMSVLVDCGALGYGSIAAHGHADALSVTLRVGGVEVMVDPGTFDYFSYPAWRRYFRSTAAHNTVTVDAVDQSVMLGPFLWGARAHARCTLWEPTLYGGRVTGEHDGYTRLPDPVVHRRTVELDARLGRVTIDDSLESTAAHAVALQFQFAEHCRVSAAGGNRLQIDVAGGRLSMELDPRFVVDVVSGCEDPPAGWISRGYHRRTAAPMVIGRSVVEPGARFRTIIQVVEPPSGASASR